MSEREHQDHRESIHRARSSRIYESPRIRKVKLQAAVNTGATGDTDGLTRGTEVGESE
jgi:hypothetical protein